MGIKHKLSYLTAAEADILKIVKFHADKVGPTSAREIYRTIREEIGRLQEFPLIGQVHPDPELAILGYRKLVLNKTYVAVYKLIDDAVMIYRVVNGTTDYPKLLK